MRQEPWIHEPTGFNRVCWFTAVCWEQAKEQIQRGQLEGCCYTLGEKWWSSEQGVVKNNQIKPSKIWWWTRCGHEKKKDMNWENGDTTDRDDKMQEEQIWEA